MLFTCCSFIEMGGESLHGGLVPQKQFAWQLRGSCRLYKQTISTRQISFPLPECDGGFKKSFFRTGVSLGIKLRCQSRSTLPSKRSSLSGKKGSLDSIVRSLESASDISKVLHSLCWDLGPKGQTAVLREQRSWQRCIQVWEFFKSQENYVPYVNHYNVVFRALGRARKWDDLRRYWTEMAENRVLPTNATYSTLIDVYGKAGLVKEALLWIKHMKLVGMFPDEITMSTVLKVLKDAGEFDRADKFYKNWCMGLFELVDLVSDPVVELSSEHFLSAELHKICGRRVNISSEESKAGATFRKPTLAGTFNTLIDLYGKAGRLEDAARVFVEMLRSGVRLDTITFNTMIFTCGSHGHLAEAESLLKEMELRGISPDVHTYSSLLSLYANSGNITKALDYYRKIRKVGLVPNVVTYRAVIHILCERNMVEEVEAVLEEMEGSGARIDEHSLPVLTKMYVDLGQLNQAKDLLEIFLKDRELSPKVCAAVMDAFAEKRLWAEAESLFLRKRTRSKKDVSEYNVMIKAYGMAKLYEKAFSLFKSMKFEGTWPDECTYDSVIQMLAGGDLVEAARDTLEGMQRAGFKPLCHTFTAVISCYARLGDISAAVDIYHEMQTQGVKPDEVVYGALINGFAQIGRVEEALQYVMEMRKSGIRPNHIVLTSLIKAYGMMGSVDAARSVYERMKSMEGGLSTIASNSIINVYADLEMVSEAEIVFKDMLDKGLADVVSFAAMMSLYRKMAMFDEAIEVAEEMKEAGFLRDCESYNQVMACYTKSGMLVELGELLYDMLRRKILPDSKTFKLIFVSLDKAGMSKEAVEQLQSSFQLGKPYSRQAIISCLFAAVGLDGRARGSCLTILNVKETLHLSIYNACIYILGSLGETNSAFNVVLKMQDKGVVSDAVTYIHLLRCYVKAGMIEGVKSIHGLLKRKHIGITKCLREGVKEAYRELNRDNLAELFTKEMALTWDRGTSNSEDDDLMICRVREEDGTGKRLTLYNISRDPEVYND